MFIAKRGFAKLTDAAKAAQAVTQSRPKEAVVTRQTSLTPSSSSSKGGVKVTRLPNDLMILTDEPNVAIARVSVAVKAGSRHEPPEVPGLTHALRSAAPLATRYCSAFGLSRNLEQMGATLSATTTRDHIIYNLVCHRSSVPEAIKFLAYAAVHQEFKAWEVKDTAYRMDVDLDIYNHQPQTQVIEYLHKAAFRDGLANSLFAPKWASDQYKSRMLKDYVQSAYRSNRMAIAALGVDHDELVNYGAELFKVDTCYFVPPKPDFDECSPDQGTIAYYYPEVNLNCKFQDTPGRYGGGEILENTLDHLAYAAVVMEGAGLNKPKEVLTLALLQQVLGVEPHIKWSNGQNASPLIRAASGSAKDPFAVSALNISHSDAGLFGFSIVAHAKDIAKIIQACLGVLRDGKGVDLKRLQDAKNRLNANIWMERESHCAYVNDLSIQALATGHVLSAADAVSLVDQLKADDIIALAKKLAGGDFTMAAVGNLSHLPRLDQLL